MAGGGDLPNLSVIDTSFIIKAYSGRPAPRLEPDSVPATLDFPINYVPPAPRQSSGFPAASNIIKLLEDLSQTLSGRPIPLRDCIIVAASDWDENNRHWEHRLNVQKTKSERERSEFERKLHSWYQQEFSDKISRQIAEERELKRIDFHTKHGMSWQSQEEWLIEKTRLTGEATKKDALIAEQTEKLTQQDVTIKKQDADLSKAKRDIEGLQERIRQYESMAMKMAEAQLQQAEQTARIAQVAQSQAAQVYEPQHPSHLHPPRFPEPAPPRPGTLLPNVHSYGHNIQYDNPYGQPPYHHPAAGPANLPVVGEQSRPGVANDPRPYPDLRPQPHGEKRPLEVRADSPEVEMIMPHAKVNGPNEARGMEPPRKRVAGPSQALIAVRENRGKVPLPRVFRKPLAESLETPSDELSQLEISVASFRLNGRELEAERSQSQRERPNLMLLKDLPEFKDIKWNAQNARRIIRIESIENLTARKKPKYQGNFRDMKDFYHLICGPLEGLYLQEDYLLVSFIHPKHAYEFFDFFNINPTAETAMERYKAKVRWITDARRDIEPAVIKAIIYEQASRCLRISKLKEEISEDLIRKCIGDALDSHQDNVLKVTRVGSAVALVEFHALSKAIKAKDLLRNRMIIDLDDTYVSYEPDSCAVHNGEAKTVESYLRKWPGTVYERE